MSLPSTAEILHWKTQEPCPSSYLSEKGLSGRAAGVLFFLSFTHLFLKGRFFQLLRVGPGESESLTCFIQVAGALLPRASPKAPSTSAFASAPRPLPARVPLLQSCLLFPSHSFICLHMRFKHLFFSSFFDIWLTNKNCIFSVYSVMFWYRCAWQNGYHHQAI